MHIIHFEEDTPNESKKFWNWSDQDVKKYENRVNCKVVAKIYGQEEDRKKDVLKNPYTEEREREDCVVKTPTRYYWFCTVPRRHCRGVGAKDRVFRPLLCPGFWEAVVVILHNKEKSLHFIISYQGKKNSVIVEWNLSVIVGSSHYQ